ncbi:SDR family NAD(P)-dependent oxidoreductase [Amorphus sp. 3PC139-8]|uniref:SDR family NAD(P)-dependent oxidoreductase n=1 Tax=Amorphus sp. 3PC139-8 TaxID=2735676 RepID=UPI00345CB423
MALVTGAAGGIGLASARALAADGCRIALADLDPDGLEQAKAALADTGAVVETIVLNVADEASVKAGFATAEAVLGPVSILVLCAGIMGGGPGISSELADVTLEQWEQVNAVNARGTFLCMREFLRRRREMPVSDGRIITLSSAAGQLGGYRGDPAYVASKAAILGLTKIAARQCAEQGITVNCIAAGPVRTGMFERAMDPDAVPGLAARIPLGRVGSADDVAGAVRYLAGDAARWITGATLDVNGGYRMQ